MTKPQKNEIPAMTRITPDNMDGLKLVAAAENRSVAFVIRSLIERCVSDFENRITKV